MLLLTIIQFDERIIFIRNTIAKYFKMLKNLIVESNRWYILYICATISRNRTNFCNPYYRGNKDTVRSKMIKRSAFIDWRNILRIGVHKGERRRKMTLKLSQKFQYLSKQLTVLVFNKVSWCRRRKCYEHVCGHMDKGSGIAKIDARTLVRANLFSFYFTLDVLSKLFFVFL